MTFRFTLVAAARSSSRLGERFDDERPLDMAGRIAVERAAPTLLPLAAAELRYCSPSPRSRETGDALGFTPLAQLALRDCDMGRWRGRTLADVMAREPATVDAWLANPRSAPHGGECLLDFITRVGGWLDTRPAEHHTKMLAVADPGVIRAAMMYALKAPPHCYWNVDIQPLSTLTLTGRPGQWRLRMDGDALR
ncbi:histidine phosphatase family protein [Streptomyces coffeae]|uniref:Histidine phosphatase family protein n=1 Tax=Streptomyces coffeae TaxID=621382 RepID=A0ABS1N954_9ACTN|nr:histidine phosphatase family protein [Streptomyces coffeae]MBL1096465.1 histidine phosphatase family protein [Streptomyces coffeae]